jgi:hypothetical protein
VPRLSSLRRSVTGMDDLASVPEPVPTDILSTAASIENIVTWQIARSITKGDRAFKWFMKYAADRVPVPDKIRLLGEVVASLRDPSIVYPEFLDDLRLINDVRVRVAHSVFIPEGETNLTPGYVNFRKGQPDRMSETDLRAEVAKALSHAQSVMDALQLIAEDSGAMPRRRGRTSAPWFAKRWDEAK